MVKMLPLILLLLTPFLHGECATLHTECNSGATGYGDFDSLHVAVVPFALPLKSLHNSYYASCNVPPGGNAYHQCGYDHLFLNQYNLDSIKIDSFRMSAQFWGDSVAIYAVYFSFYEIGSDDDKNQVYVYTSGGQDSLYMPDGESTPNWESKTFTQWTGNTAILAPYLGWSNSIYIDNRTTSSVTVRIYTYIMIGRAFYTAKP